MCEFGILKKIAEADSLAEDCMCQMCKIICVELIAVTVLSLCGPFERQGLIATALPTVGCCGGLWDCNNASI